MAASIAVDSDSNLTILSFLATTSAKNDVKSASSEIEVEYKQPGYLDINRRKYNDLTIALGLALNQLEGKNLKENFEKIKDEIRYDGDHSAEGNVYKSLSLKSNYESALNKKIDLHSYVISRIENNKSDE